MPQALIFYSLRIIFLPMIFHGLYDIFYDEDNEYSKYGGYNGYDDQTIDDAFEGDPSLTWNID